ncbi:MAG: hypothetical protein ACR2JH_11395 [Solirubrobacteraceae bacterium]
MTTVTINDEGTRRSVLFAIWEHAAAEIGEDFYDALHLEARASCERAGPSQIPWFHLVSGEMALMQSTAAAAAAVQTAGVGQTVDIDVPEAALAHGLSACSAQIAEDEGFWLKEGDERDRDLATFDAAQALIRDLDREAVA